MYTHTKDVVAAGVPVNEADKVLIMLHGRGSTAQDIISLSKHFDIHNAAFLAPQATNHSWYPYSFLAPEENNQPALNSSIDVIGALLNEIEADAISPAQVYFVGFSQGACLSLEFAARNAAKYGGVIALTGGLIGQTLNLNNYKGEFNGTPILITTGDSDPHVPVDRVYESEGILTKMGADVTVKIYKGRPHTILKEEINLAANLILHSKDV
jgi:phospholipase/carboxylesterase